MLRRALILLLLIAPAAARAEEKKASGPAGQYVDLQPMAMPIVVNGSLLNYVFVNVRINFAPSADIQKMRDKEPFFRDALVRDSHRNPYVLASDYQKVDEARLIATAKRIAGGIVGPGLVQSVVLVSQAPQRRVVTPKPAPAARP